jgi:hypothetical protein
MVLTFSDETTCSHGQRCSRLEKQQGTYRTRGLWSRTSRIPMRVCLFGILEPSFLNCLLLYRFPSFLGLGRPFSLTIRVFPLLSLLTTILFMLGRSFSINLTFMICFSLRFSLILLLLLGSSEESFGLSTGHRALQGAVARECTDRRIASFAVQLRL